MTRENTDWHEDAGKPRVDLIPVLSLTEVGKVMAYGAEKYGQHNWSKYAGRWAWTQLIASALRHLLAVMRGEDIDPESGLYHLAHVLANIMMLLDLQIMGKGIDDRNPVYNEPQEVDEWEEFDIKFLRHIKAQGNHPLPGDAQYVPIYKDEIPMQIPILMEKPTR